jgi:hypothetical protein
MRAFFIILGLTQKIKPVLCTRIDAQHFMRQSNPKEIFSLCWEIEKPFGTHTNMIRRELALSQIEEREEGQRLLAEADKAFDDWWKATERKKGDIFSYEIRKGRYLNKVEQEILKNGFQEAGWVVAFVDTTGPATNISITIN